MVKEAWVKSSQKVPESERNIPHLGKLSNMFQLFFERPAARAREVGNGRLVKTCYSLLKEELVLHSEKQ